MMKHLVKKLLMSFLLMVPSLPLFGQESESPQIPPEGGVNVSSMHSVMLQPAPEVVSGMYFLVVQNTNSVAVEETVEFYIPKSAQDLELSPQIDVLDFDSKPGLVKLKSSFKPGRSILPLRFLLPVKDSKVELAMNFGEFIEAFQLMIPASTLAEPMDAEYLEQTDDRTIQGITYRSYLVDGIGSNQNVKNIDLTIAGLPQGRRPYWIYGIVCMVMMLLSGGVLSWKSHRSALSNSSSSS